MWECIQKIADSFTIGGLIIAVAVAVLAFAGFTWVRGRAWLQREVWLKIKGSPLRGGKYITLTSEVFSKIPADRHYKGNGKDFDPNKVESTNEDKRGKNFRMNASVGNKDGWVTDWKGRRYSREGYALKEIWLQVWPYSYKDANEWKVAVSILKRDLPAPVPYEHRLFGKRQISFEISRHHSEGKQAILGVFEGHPLKVRSDGISEGNWTWLGVRIGDKKIEFFVGFECIAVFDTGFNIDIRDFSPGELWLVFWADEQTDMAVRFRRIKTYWRKNTNLSGE